MRRVILESPFAGCDKAEQDRNVKYARRCVRDCVLRWEAPIASHLLYTQEGILDDSVPEERKLGIAAGLAWLSVAEAMVVYIDHGVSAGMRDAIALAKRQKIRIEIRAIWPAKMKEAADVGEALLVSDSNPVAT